MKKLLTLSFLAAFSSLSMAQTTATNFTVSDCNGNNHDLFTELDAGKVVVLVWVMPCGACTGPAKTAYNIAGSYSSSHPGVVKYYMVDDYANSACNVVSNWAASNNVYPDAVFSNSSISMSAYGSDGMPKVVILGGTDHKVFFNQNDAAAGNSTGIQNAMNQAISVATSIRKSVVPANDIRIYPNPATDKISVSFLNKAVTDVSIDIFSVTGTRVTGNTYLKQPAGALTYEISLADLPKGVYYVSINGNFQKLSIL